MKWNGPIIQVDEGPGLELWSFHKQGILGLCYIAWWGTVDEKTMSGR